MNLVGAILCGLMIVGLLFCSVVYAQHNCAAPNTKAAEWVAQYKAGGAPLRIEWRSTSGVRVKIAIDGCLVIIHAENPIILEPSEAKALGEWIVEWYGVKEKWGQMP